MKKAALENVQSSDAQLQRFCRAVKQNMDQITGQVRNAKRLEPLPANATLAQVIARLNEITERLQ